MTPFGVTGNERVKLNPGLETRILGLETRYSMISNPLKLCKLFTTYANLYSNICHEIQQTRNQ